MLKALSRLFDIPFPRPARRVFWSVVAAALAVSVWAFGGFHLRYAPAVIFWGLLAGYFDATADSDGKVAWGVSGAIYTFVAVTYPLAVTAGVAILGNLIVQHYLVPRRTPVRSWVKRVYNVSQLLVCTTIARLFFTAFGVRSVWAFTPADIAAVVATALLNTYLNAAFVVMIVAASFGRPFRHALADMKDALSYALATVFLSILLGITFTDRGILGLMVLLGVLIYVQRALHYQRELRKQLEETHRAQEAAYRDPMTGLHNFRYLQAYIGEKVNLGKTFAAMMIDLDHFKSVNDTHGHQIGDEVLRQVGNVLRDHVQGRDAAVRYGGEEFSVVLLDISPEDAKAKAETIRQAIADRGIPRPGGEVRVTASIGLAMYPLDGQTPEAVYKVADHRLYMAKENGRDRVVGRPKDKETGKLAG